MKIYPELEETFGDKIHKLIRIVADCEVCNMSAFNPNEAYLCSIHQETFDMLMVWSKNQNVE